MSYLSRVTLAAGKALNAELNPDRKRGERPGFGIIVLVYPEPENLVIGEGIETDVGIDITGNPLFAANVMQTVIMRLAARFGGSDK